MGYEELELQFARDLKINGLLDFGTLQIVKGESILSDNENKYSFKDILEDIEFKSNFFDYFHCLLEDIIKPNSYYIFKRFDLLVIDKKIIYFDRLLDAINYGKSYLKSWEDLIQE
jgi:hypothetical protein